ncbi:hypothetical protein [Methanogenium cariaci]|uniref:hypothetical protein n=1 Tax=Methanogenium cariaci TaxID=2197 RepID=UPI00247FB902|nr:hypothetical protein [Methanogenium cariaci]
MKQGQTIPKPSYNHTTGSFDAPARFRRRRLLLWKVCTLFQQKTCAGCLILPVMLTLPKR